MDHVLKSRSQVGEEEEIVSPRDKGVETKATQSSAQVPHQDGGQYIVSWDVDDPLNPRNFSRFRKWLIVIIVSISCSCFTCASSIYVPTFRQITVEFDCTRLQATAGLSLFVVGMGFGPMIFGGLSEYFGRRKIFIVSFSLFIIWLIPCAVAQNLPTMLGARFFTGLAGSAFLSVAGGTVVDLFPPTDMQTAMTIFTASPFIGPEFGPLLGGFINENTNWRWSFYTMIIWSTLLLVLIVLFVPETYHPILLRDKARKLRERTSNSLWIAPIEMGARSKTRNTLEYLYRPFALLFKEPKCLILCIYTAILLGIIYLFFSAFEIVFVDLHDFSLSQVGLSFAGLLLGIFIAVLLQPYTQQRPSKSATSLTGTPNPGARLYPAMYGGILIPIGLFWFGWTLKRSISFIVPIVGSVLFAIGTILVYCGVFTFLVAEYPAHAASALSANCFLRSMFAAIFPLFGNQMYQSLGYSWATTVLAFITLAMVPFPFLFSHIGQKYERRKTLEDAAS